MSALDEHLHGVILTEGKCQGVSVDNKLGAGSELLIFTTSKLWPQRKFQGWVMSLNLTISTSGD